MMSTPSISVFTIFIVLSFVLIIRFFSKTFPQWSLLPPSVPQWGTETFLTVKEGSTFHLGLLPSGKKKETALLCCICPTCSSPAEGSLILNQAFPLTIKGKDVAGSAIAPPEFWYRQRSLCPQGVADESLTQ